MFAQARLYLGIAAALVCLGVGAYGAYKLTSAHYQHTLDARNVTIGRMEVQAASADAALKAADAATQTMQAQAATAKDVAAQAVRSAQANAAKARAMDTAWRERLAQAKHDDTQTQCGPVLQMHLPASVGTSY